MTADREDVVQERAESLYRQALAIQSLLETVRAGEPVPEPTWYLAWYLSRDFVWRVDELRCLLGDAARISASACPVAPAPAASAGTPASAGDRAVPR